MQDHSQKNTFGDVAPSQVSKYNVVAISWSSSRMAGVVTVNKQSFRKILNGDPVINGVNVPQVARLIMRCKLVRGITERQLAKMYILSTISFMTASVVGLERTAMGGMIIKQSTLATTVPL